MPARITALQTDVRARGARVRVIVFDRSSRLAACGRYGLALDPAGAQMAVAPQ